jgi:hypothetical protein
VVEGFSLRNDTSRSDDEEEEERKKNPPDMMKCTHIAAMCLIIHSSEKSFLCVIKDEDDIKRLEEGIKERFTAVPMHSCASRMH